MQKDGDAVPGQPGGCDKDEPPAPARTLPSLTRPPRRSVARAAPDPVETARRQMLRAVQRQVRMIDKRLSGEGAEVEERDSRILGNLAKTLVTLLEIGAGGKGTKDKEPTDRGDAEARLAARLEAWAREGA